jgi:hypothetical protein
LVRVLEKEERVEGLKKEKQSDDGIVFWEGTLERSGGECLKISKTREVVLCSNEKSRQLPEEV